MRNILAVTLITSLLFSISLIAKASPSQEVVCAAGKWSGTSINVKDGVSSTTTDSMELPKTTYIIDPYEEQAIVLTSGKEVSAKILNRYNGSLSYTVVSYVFGGVSYTDTIYQNGFVFVQYAKMSLWGEPYASTVSQQCIVLN